MTLDDLKLVLALGNQPWPVVYGIWQPETSPGAGNDYWLQDPDGSLYWALVPHTLQAYVPQPDYGKKSTYRVAVMPPDGTPPTVFWTPTPPPAPTG